MAEQEQPTPVGLTVALNPCDILPRAKSSLVRERTPLTLVPHSQSALAESIVYDLDERLGGDRGEMQEYPDKNQRSPTLFRYTGFDGVCSVFSIPHERLTSHVRALLWELAEAVEDEGRR